MNWTAGDGLGSRCPFKLVPSGGLDVTRRGHFLFCSFIRALEIVGIGFVSVDKSFTYALSLNTLNKKNPLTTNLRSDGCY